MYNGQIVRYLLEKRRIPNKELLKYIGKDKEGGNSALRQIISGNPTVRTLEPVADFFGVSMDVFFKREVAFVPSSSHVVGNGNAVGNGNTIMTPTACEFQAQIEHLQQLLEEKDKRIETLETLVQILKESK